MSFAAALLAAFILATAAFAAEPDLGVAPDASPVTSSATSRVTSDERRAVLPANEEESAQDEPLYASPTRRDRIGRIMAPVMINGQGPFRFVIDTGATHSVLSAHLVRRLGLAADDGPGVLLRGVTGSAVVATAQVAQLQAGDLIIRNSSMPIVDSVLSGADGVLGTLGLEIGRAHV